MLRKNCGFYLGWLMLNHTLRNLAVAAAFAMVSSAANAATISSLYNTGVDASHAVLGHGMADPHYTIISAPSGSNSVAQTIVTGFPIGPWLANNSTSRWIGPANNPSSPNDPAGIYTYTTTFDLTGYVASSALIIGQWATDNSGWDILINNQGTGQSASSFTGWTSFSIDPAKLVNGLNTLTFVVLNLDQATGNPTGLRVEFTTATASAVPLPAPLLLFATGLGVVGLYSRRKKRKAA